MTHAVKIDKFKVYNERVMKMKKDPHLFISHSSLYNALFICLQQNGGITPFSVNRRILMSYSNIASTATYHKCIKKLVELGYIKYSPSYHPIKGSLISWQEEVS
jgi:hypothetical protein